MPRSAPSLVSTMWFSMRCISEGAMAQSPSVSYSAGKLPARLRPSPNMNAQAFTPASLLTCATTALASSFSSVSSATCNGRPRRQIERLSDRRRGRGRRFPAAAAGGVSGVRRRQRCHSRFRHGGPGDLETFRVFFCLRGKRRGKICSDVLFFLVVAHAQGSRRADSSGLRASGRMTSPARFTGFDEAAIFRGQSRRKNFRRND